MGGDDGEIDGAAVIQHEILFLRRILVARF